MKTIDTNWLEMRMEELKNAYVSKLSGHTQLWLESDCLVGIDEYIKIKISDIENYVERNTK
jgi:hypothetical protein